MIIKSISGKTLYEDDSKTIKETLENAVKNKLDLQGADLQWTDLQGANLQWADLQDAIPRVANLQGANLQWANLQGANLQGAKLQDANLQWVSMQGTCLRVANLHGANLQDANLQGANLQDANLQWADMQDANLKRADLKGAYLQKADLKGVNLQDADLRLASLQGADLRWAEGFNKFLINKMYFLLFQEKSFLFKLVNQNYQGPVNGGITYKVGEEVLVKDYDISENITCGAGINLATLDWCLNNLNDECKILLCEFNREDIVCIPISNDGKIRVKRCKVIRELSPHEYGIKEKENNHD